MTDLQMKSRMQDRNCSMQPYATIIYNWYVLKIKLIADYKQEMWRVIRHAVVLILNKNFPTAPNRALDKLLDVTNIQHKWQHYIQWKI